MLPIDSNSYYPLFYVLSLVFKVMQKKLETPLPKELNNLFKKIMTKLICNFGSFLGLAYFL